MNAFFVPLPQNSHAIQIGLKAASLRKVDFCLNERQCDVCLLRVCKKKKALKIDRSILLAFLVIRVVRVIWFLHKPSPVV